MTTLLVTGTGGFIGRHALRLAQARGLEVVAVPHAWDSRDALESMVGTSAISHCLHLGWYASPGDYLVSNSGNLRSLAASLELVELLRDRGARHLVVAGSSAEYLPRDRALVEEDTVAPWSIYGAAKHALHGLLQSSLRPQGMTLAWGRIFNVTGPGEAMTRLLPSSVRILEAGGVVELTDGQQRRDFLHVEDVANAFLVLLLEGAEGAFNVSSGTGRTLREILEGVLARVGCGRLDFGARPRPANDVPCSVGDNSRLVSLGWRPKHDFGAALDAVVAYARTARDDVGLSAPR